MDKELEEEEEEDLEEKHGESERKHGRKVQHVEASRAGVSRASTGTRREGGVVRRVQRHEEEEVVRSVTIRQRRLVGSLAKTSDYSSQSDTEKETAQLRTPTNNPSRLDSRRDSPRLKAFDGDEWIYSPRTGYTYAQSLTYRDAATPGREIPMPHMARLPLHEITHDYSQLDQLDTTEVWERSIREARTLAEFSDDEFSPSPPHKIFRRGTWSLAGATKASSSSSLYSYLHTLFFLLMLPLSILLSWSKLVFRVLVYDMPAFTHRVDLSLLLKSEHLKGALSSGLNHTTQLFLMVASSLSSLLDRSSTMALKVTSGTSSWVVNLFDRFGEWFKPTLLLKDTSGLISEDEDESGLTNFLISQKEQSATEDRVETSSSRASSAFTRLLEWFNPSVPLSLMDGSGLISEDEDESGLSSFLISQKEQRPSPTEKAGAHSLGFVSMIKTVTEWVLTISTYVLALLGPRVPSNYTEAEEDQPERVRSPKRVMFKDLPEEPETGGVSPIWVEEIPNEAQEAPAHPEDTVSEKQQQHGQVTEQPQTNGIQQHGSPEATSSYGAFVDIIGVPFSMTMSVIHSVWASLTKQPEPELRRSRRLRGLNPEQRALERERRRRERKQRNGGKTANLTLVTDDDDSDAASSFADLNVKEKPKLKKPKSPNVEHSSLWSWFVSIFYRQKTRRRSRRLLGLDPEMEAYAAEKRTRGARKKKEMFLDVSTSNQPGDADAEDSLSDIEDEDDEAEFIPFAMLTSIWLAIKTFFSESMPGRVWFAGKDSGRDTSPDEVENAQELPKEKGTKKQGIIRRALDSKSPFWSWGVSFFFRQKPRRRSRRLQGLGPEMEGQLDKMSGRRSTRRTKTENQEIDQTVSENLSMTEESFLDSDSDSDEIEFVPWAFLVSLWQSLYSFINRTTHTDEEESSNTNKTSLLKQTSIFISNCWMKFASQFYRPKPKRRSRRLMGLQPEMEGEEARKRKSRKANGANGTNNTEAAASVSTNMEEQDIGIAEMITEMDSDEDEEVEFIPFAIIISVWEQLRSVLFSTSTEPEKEQFEAESLESEKVFAVEREPMHKRFSGYIFTIWSWFAALFYRPRQTRASRRLRGLAPELTGEQVTRKKTKKTRSSAKKDLGDVSDTEVDNSQLETSSDNEDDEGDEFIPFALLCSLWTTVKSAMMKEDVKEVQPQNGQIPEDPDTKSSWSLAWIDWGYLKQAFKSTPREVAALNGGMNGGPTTSSDHVEPKTVGSIVAWTSFAWIWFASIFYREKQTRRSRRLMGLGPEMEAAAEKRRALRKRTAKGAQEETIETPSEDLESPTEKEYEFIPKAWALTILASFGDLFHWLSAHILAGSSNLSEENLRRHNARSIAAGGDRRSVGTWLGNSQHGQSTEESLVATAFNEVEVSKDTVEAPIEEGIEMTKKAKNMFSFLFDLGFLPTWSTSWFWSSKGTRKSRRLRGLDPVEIDALETWKSRTRAGKASSGGSVIEKDGASETSEDDYSTDKYLLLLLFFLLGISLLYLAILPFCSANPDTCRAPYRSLTKAPATVSHLFWTARNSTVDLLHFTGDRVITGARHLQDLLASSAYSLSSSFSGFWDFTASLLGSPWRLLDQVISSVSSLGSWILVASSNKLTSAANIAADLANVTIASCGNIFWSASSGISSIGRVGWDVVNSFTVSSWETITNGLTTLFQGLGDVVLSCWSGLSALPSFISSIFIAPLSGLVSILHESLLFLGDLGSSTIETIANGAWQGLFLFQGLASKPAGLLVAGFNLTVTSLQDLASSSLGLAASIWDGGVSTASSLIDKVYNIDFFYPVYQAGHTLAHTTKTVSSSMASLLAWPLTLDYFAPFSSAWKLLSSASSGFAAWVGNFDLTAPFSWLANLLGDVCTAVMHQISSLNLFAPFTWTWTMITSSYNSLLGWTANLDPSAIFSWIWNLVASSWDNSTAWILGLNLLSPFYWTWNSAISCSTAVMGWMASLSPLAPLSAAWTFVISNCQEFSSWLLSIDPLAPFAWIGSSALSLTTSMWSSFAEFCSSLLDYQGFSSFHLSPITWLLNTGTTCLLFLQESALSAYESFLSINLLSPVSWVWSFLSSSASAASTGLTAAGGAVGASIGATASSIGLLLAAAWTRATSLVIPEKSSSSENQLDLDQLIEKVLNSNRFLSAVNDIANKKVEGEASRFQEQMAANLATQQLSQEEQSKVTADYQSRLESIKVDVAEEIKKMTEQYVKINMESVEQSKAKADAQDFAINGLKEKYLQMLADTEALQASLASQGNQVDGANQETLKEVAALKAQILALEEQQKILNETLAGCCKNASTIEISVERHLANLMESVIAGGEGGSEAAKTFSSWLTTHLVARTELEARLSALSSEMEARLGSKTQETGATLKKEVEEVGQQIMDRVSQELRQEMERQLHVSKVANTDAPPQQGLNRTEVLEIVKNSLIQYDADKTGMFDYALETAGGSVVSTRCTETFVQKTAMYSIFGIPIWYPSNNPRTIIQPGVQPGECWAFKGSSGYIVIQLSEAIVPTRFSMEHISKTMSPSGKIDSAPKDFVMYGLRSEKDVNPVRLGAFTYSQDTGDPLQFFELTQPVTEPFPFVELDILSNHGNVNYTCLYRFRVHGLRPQ